MCSYPFKFVTFYQGTTSNFKVFYEDFNVVDQHKVEQQ